MDIPALAQCLARDLSDAHGVTLCLHPTAQGVAVASLIVPKTRQGQGVGSAVLAALTAWADEVGATLLLTPGQRDPHHGTTSRARLTRFYRRFGFRPNTGRRKDFSHSYGMVRPPR